MTETKSVASTSGVRKALAWLFGMVCFGFVPVMMLWAWKTSFYARTWLYVVAPVIGVVLIAHWYLLFGRRAFMSRLKRFACFAAALGVLVMLGANLLRYEGSRGGSSFPRFAWRWSPEAQSAVALEEGVVIAPAITAGESKVEAEIDSAQFYGPNRDGRVTTDGSLDWVGHPPVEVWRRPMGLGWSGFAVVGSRAVTQEQRGEEEWVSCYDLGSGELLWKHTDEARFDEKMSGAGPRSTPTVVGERVWTAGATGILNCLDLQTGKLVWTRQVLDENGATNLQWGKSTSPLWIDGQVVVSGGMSRATLVCYDAETGEPKWTYDGNGASFSSPIVAKIDGVEQIVSLNSVDATGNDPKTGEELWRWDWPGAFPKVGQPVIVGDGKVLLTASYGAGGHLLQVERKGEAWSVSRLWQTSRMKTKFSSATVIGDFAYGIDESIFACIDLSDGSKVWKGGRYGFGQQLLVNGETFLVQTERGRVVLVAATPEEHRELGELAGLEDSGGISWNPPTLAGRYLLLRNEREAVCYRLGVAGAEG